MARYAERQRLPYAPRQLFDLVADVESYPEFLPWVVSMRIVRREGDRIWVDMEVGTSFICRRFATEAVLDRPNRIDIRGRDALFERYHQTWTFEPADNNGTDVEFQIDFQFRARLLQSLMGSFLDDATTAMIGAFKRRARRVYDERGGPGA